MPDYTVQDTQTGKTVTFQWSGEKPPTDSDMADVFAAARQQTPAQAAPPAPQERSWTNTIGDVARGAEKGAVGTFVGLGELVHKIPGVSTAVDTLYGTPGVSQHAFADATKVTQPTNAAESVGHTAERIGEFFIPAGNIKRGAEALKTGSGILNTLVRSGLEGASAAGVTAAQTGSPTAGLASGAITAGATAATGPLGRMLKPLGERIETALIKPTAADVRDGFRIGNVFKNQVGGTLSQTYDKVQGRIDGLVGQVQRAISASPATVNIGDVFAQARQRLTSNLARTFGTNTGIAAALDKLESDPFVIALKKSGGDMDLAMTQHAKIAMGDLGAWLHDPTGRAVVDPEAKAVEQVANTVYDILKTQIEQKAVGPVKALNAQLSELIPIRRAVIRRIPVEARQNVFNLGDLLSLSHHTLGLSIANRLLRSGQVANAMVASAPAVEAAAPAVGRTVGGVVGGLVPQPAQ